MTLNQLKYFIEIHKTGSMQKAADKLSISQSTLSAAIKNLEQEFSVQLFERTPRGLKLNEAGMALLLHAQNMLKIENEMINDMRRFSDGEKVIRFGMPPILSQIYWPGLWIELGKLFPDYSFESYTDTRSVLIEMLNNSSLDLAVLAAAESLPLPAGCNSYPLIPYNGRYIAVSVRHELAKRTSVSIHDIARYDILSYRKGESQSQILAKGFAKIGETLRYKLVCSELSTLISLIRKNAGIAFLNPRIIREIFQRITAEEG